MKWRVMNLHPTGLTHREKFRGDLVEIKAGKENFVLMDYEDAVLFKGQYFPITKDSMGQQTPESYKCIKIEAHEPGTQAEAKKTYVCHVDGREFSSKAELEAYVEAKYGDVEPFRDEALETEIKKTASIDPAQKKRIRKPKEETLP